MKSSFASKLHPAVRETSQWDYHVFDVNEFYEPASFLVSYIVDTMALSKFTEDLFFFAYNK